MKLPPMPLGLFIAAQLPLLAAETGPVRTGADLLPPIGAIGFTETDKAGKEAPNKDIAAVERLAQELERAKNQEKAKPKLAIVDIAVSVEGIPRPDLGTALTDTFMARLLELDVFELVDSGSMIGEGDIMSLAPTGNARVSAPSPSPAVEMGRAVGADFVVAPTLLYSQGVWRLTMRKLRIPDGKVDAIIQQNRRGDETAAYELITSTAERLMPEEAYQPRFAYIKAWMSDPPEPQPEPVPKALPPTPERRAQIRSKAARAWATNSQQEREPVACGRIQVVDFDWAFCEIYAPGNQFKANDEIFAWSGVQSELGASVVLKVSRVEGSKVIADFNRGANSQPLAVGNTIYRWEVKK